MAAPYLLLSFAPRLVRYVPRPGAWMETFKQLMGFFLMATVVFLAWLLGQQAGNDGVASLLAGLVVVGMGAWAYGRGHDTRQLAGASQRALVLGVALRGWRARPGSLGCPRGPPERRVTAALGGLPGSRGVRSAWRRSARRGERSSSISPLLGA